MQSFWSKSLFYFGSLAACSVLALTTGCASGGFKLTRQYARWVNSQNIILRIVLYILTSVVFAVTMLIDVVVFNTIDFWEGKVSEGTYEFKEGTKTYFVRHEILPETKLKRSTIQVFDANRVRLQEVVLHETPSKEVELIVDGKVRTRASDISKIPVVSIFDERGSLVESKYLTFQAQR